jgi:cbb3-type cytochrome oxidase subunit 3
MDVLVGITSAIALLAVAALLLSCALFVYRKAQHFEIDIEQRLEDIQRRKDDEDDILGV